VGLGRGGERKRGWILGGGKEKAEGLVRLGTRLLSIADGDRRL